MRLECTNVRGDLVLFANVSLRGRISELQIINGLAEIPYRSRTTAESKESQRDDKHEQ